MKLKEAIQSANLHAATTHARAKADAVEGKATHTPGPWKVKGRKMEARIYGNVDGGAVAIVHYTIEYASNPQDEANARLIAAAPELLEALEACLGPLQDEYNRATHTGHATNASRAFVRAKQAILKAKGQQ